ncbi:MAG: Na/Pi cotransporter family protein [Lachnospiraceae bacterium]
MDIFGILAMIGGLALFLFGMNFMGAGLEKLSGGRLERILEKLTSNPFKAVFLGAGVTAVIQSSSATTVMVVGFVNSGIMKLSQAIGIIMGANVGTTITAWILSLTGIESSNVLVNMLKPSSFAPILAMVGIIMYMSAKSEKKKDVGGILVGFAILMTGMEMMSSSVEPLADSPEFVSILTKFSNPILGIIAGALLTAVIQSSSASVGILQALSVTGAFTYSSVIPIIMGQNIGTCITAILSAIGGNRNAKRTAAVHLFFNLLGTLVFILIYSALNAMIHFSFADEVVGIAGIALIHTTFNIMTTLMLLPFTKGLEKLAYLVFPVLDYELEAQDNTFLVLDDRFLNTPGYAIDQSQMLVNQMGEIAKTCFVKAMAVLKQYSELEAEEVISLEQRIDLYDDKINRYLTKLSGQGLSVQESQNVSMLMHTITDFERITDHAIHIVESAKTMDKKGYSFSPKAQEEMNVYGRAVEDILNRTVDTFSKTDMEEARKIEPLEEYIDSLNKEIKKRHLKRLRKGRCSIDVGLILSDIATDYERVADHCSNIAVYLMQEKDADIEAHSYMSSLNGSEKEEFARQVEEYAKIYALPER